MTSPTDRFDIVSHVEGALPSLLSPAPMMMERLAAMTVWISRPATWYSTCSAPVCQDPQSPYQHRRQHHRRRQHRSLEQVIIDPTWEEWAFIFVTGRIGCARTRAMAVVWLRKCPGLSVGRQPQTAKLLKVTSVLSARICRLMRWDTSHRSRLLSPPHSAVSCNLHGLHGGMLSHGNRSTVNGSTPLQGLTLSCLFPALVSVSICRRELSYKHAAQLYHQLGSRRRQGTRILATLWRLLGTALNSVGLIRPGIPAGLAVPCATSRLSCDASLSRKLANLLVPLTCDTRATLWQLLGANLCWAGVFCVTQRLSCDANPTRKFGAGCIPVCTFAEILCDCDFLATQKCCLSAASGFV
ncbi:hypothetical protein F5888DRAFT_1689610 [Russula emetica]|nr:hypothetical protein F5888DRAFT_1689610 [Russula emetica]